MVEGLALVCEAYANKCVIQDGDATDPQVLYRLLHQALTMQTDGEHRLLQAAHNHLIPHHIERNWIRYATALFMVGTLLRAKKDPHSKLNAFLDQHRLNEYGGHFADFCNQYVVFHFKRLMNALFGYPIDNVEEYSENVRNSAILIKGYKGNKVDFEKNGDDQKPENFDIPFTILIPGTDLAIVESTIGMQYINGNLKTHKIFKYLLYEIIKFVVAWGSDALNISIDVDLILKLVSATPFCAAGYGGYKMISGVYKKITFVDKDPLCTALLGMEQFIVERILQQDDGRKMLDDQVYGKLVFLLFQVKKHALKVFTTSQYKLFLKDIRTIMRYNAQWKAKKQMIDIIMKKYKVATCKH
jgi:hypothetical protein